MKILWKTFLALGVVVALSTTSFAYLDPSVMTYIIQAVAGVVVAVGAIAGVAWRRAKKKINKTLKTDENAHKEVEEDVKIIDTESDTGAEDHGDAEK